MRSSIDNLPCNVDSPGQILLSNYLIPKGVTVREFSALSGVPTATLRDIIKGERMSNGVISRVSATTRTAPRYWHYLQETWQFHQYLHSGKAPIKIEPISLPLQTHSFEAPGQVLDREFIKPSGKSYRSIEEKYKIRYPLLCDIVRGKKSITPLVARQLEAAFGVSTKYWLDLQSCYELRKLIDTSPVSDGSIYRSLDIFFSRVAVKERSPGTKKKLLIHPGKILMMQFIKPSGINVQDWRKILCIRIREFKEILSSKRSMSSEVILKVARVFKPDVGYWIDINNAYYARWAEGKYSKLFKRSKNEKKGISDDVKYQPSPPFKFLEDNFLRPMHLPRKHLLRHIGIRARGYGDDLRRIPRVNFEFASRIGQALNMSPWYWFFLQMEYNIHSHEGSGLERIQFGPSGGRLKGTKN